MVPVGPEMPSGFTFGPRQCLWIRKGAWSTGEMALEGRNVPQEAPLVLQEVN